MHFCSSTHQCDCCDNLTCLRQMVFLKALLSTTTSQSVQFTVSFSYRQSKRTVLCNCNWGDRSENAPSLQLHAASLTQATQMRSRGEVRQELLDKSNESLPQHCTLHPCSGQTGSATDCRLQVTLFLSASVCLCLYISIFLSTRAFLSILIQQFLACNAAMTENAWNNTVIHDTRCALEGLTRYTHTTHHIQEECK